MPKIFPDISIIAETEIAELMPKVGDFILNPILDKKE
jgi:hypothetical protein